MPKSDPWKEEAWEELLKKVWDNRSKNENVVKYTKSDLDPILSRFPKSGQGEIRIFNSSSKSMNALKRRNVVKIPVSRGAWIITISPPKLDFTEPQDQEIFIPINKLTEGMISGIKESRGSKANPGETTLLAIANHVGIISDFYNQEKIGAMFTGGRQNAGVNILIDNKEFDISKAQIEIDGGFEWMDTIVVVEMKSSFKQSDFDTNQSLLPMLKWEDLIKNKAIHSLVVLAQTNKHGIEYRLYDLDYDSSKSAIGMKIVKSKKYILNID